MHNDQAMWGGRLSARVLGKVSGLWRAACFVALAMPAFLAHAGPTTTELASSLNPSTVGQTVTFTATVAGVSPTGNVTFKRGSTNLATVNLVGNVATYSTNALPGGSSSITAKYNGDGTNSNSTSDALIQVVNGTPTSTAVTSSLNPSLKGQQIALTATVTGNSPGGTVIFKDGGTQLTNRGLNNGAATYNVSNLAAGSHNITVEYLGDTNNASSTSAVFVQVVGPTTTTLTSNPNPSTWIQAVTLTATVTGNAPSGSVTFVRGPGSYPLGSANLAGAGNTRNATLNAGALPPGMGDIVAIYSGDANNASSMSPPYVQQINPLTTPISLTATASTSTYGQTVTWIASLGGGYSSAANVTFKDGNTVLFTRMYGDSGIGPGPAFSSAGLSVGSHTITATFSGDAYYSASTSAAQTLTVNPRATTTTLVASANPVSVGQTVTWTATIIGTNPSGVITFKDGSTVLGTSTIASGTAALSTSALTSGVHGITAVYGGDVNHAASTSAELPQTINKRAVTLNLASGVNPSSAGNAVALTASISGGINPSGLVTFKDDATVLGTGSVSGGTATFSASGLGLGSHNLTAVYEGDANHAVGTSGILVQTVNPPAATATLSATPIPASAGQAVTLIVQLGGNSPTGTVTFNSGGVTIGTAAVSAGAATLSISSLATGTHSLSAAYSGDATNAASNSNTVSLTVNAQGAFTWQYAYDAIGRVNTVVDPNSSTTTIGYFELNRPDRLIQIQQPPNTGTTTATITQKTYDSQGNLTSVVDPRVLSTNYTVSGAGTVKSQTSPDTGDSQFAYDVKGNLTSSVDARGKTTTFAFDNLDRLIVINYPTGTGTTFEYDGVGRTPLVPAETGELTKMIDESGNTNYFYDALGRLITKTTIVGSKTFTVGYSWGDTGSALDKLTAITYPSGSRVNYGYDDKGYVNAISVNAVNANGSGTSGTANPLLTGIAYNADNNPTGWLWSDGKRRTIGYDSVGRISSYSLGDPLGSGTTRSVSRDSAGRITGYSHASSASALDQGFAYDNLDRLTSQTVNSTSTSYSYDEAGNRTSKTIGGMTYTNTIAATSNKLTQSQDVGGTASVQYDAAGHITADGTNTYTYNDRGRMASAITPGGIVSYSYNGLNQRASKTASGGTRYYLYDEGGQLLGEYDSTGAPVYETVYLGMTPVGVLKQTGTAATNDITVMVYNVSGDHVATPRIITKQDHTIVWRWDTAEAFGGTAPDQNPDGLGLFTFNQRFPGQVFDQETGLFQNWNREYIARMGRYAQSDPIGLNGGINTFTYVGGNPLSRVDPRGLIATGSWIKSPIFNIQDYGIDDWNIVSPSWSWWGYVKFVRLYGHANGFVNIDVKCRDECREWEVHDRVGVDAKGNIDVGPNVYAVAGGLASRNPYVGIGLNFLVAGGSLLQAEHHFLDLVGTKAGPVISALSALGPTGICLRSTR